ncbi:MAG: pyrroline-5-carboxylate reductase [Campylobacteraceae bacterium 4484_166]|nr:MAG: pyrroline-5-carboxylate reductase [Campylobacteraceae bacterium 4484_166]
MTITFVGCGTMAKAMIKPLIKKYNIEVIARDEKVLKEMKKNYCDIKTILLDQNTDITNKNIILSTKPDSLDKLKLKGKADTLYSILAGTSIDKLKQNILADKYIRVMPNIAAIYQNSMTTITGDRTNKQNTIELFENIGDVLWLSSEDELDIATAVAGSGPAYLSIIASGLIDGAVSCGLKREYGKKLVEGLFKGFTRVLGYNHPELIKDEVTSPNGTTIKGCEVMESASIRATMTDAVKAGYNQAVTKR